MLRERVGVRRSNRCKRVIMRKVQSARRVEPGSLPRWRLLIGILVRKRDIVAARSQARVSDRNHVDRAGHQSDWRAGKVEFQIQRVTGRPGVRRTCKC